MICGGAYFAAFAYTFLKKVLTFAFPNAIIALVVQQNGNGGLAQLGEHLPYKQEVTGSSPVVPTRKSLVL